MLAHQENKGETENKMINPRRKKKRRMGISYTKYEGWRSHIKEEAEEYIVKRGFC